MTLHQLRIFETVARYNNISKASKELHISQPAISQQLKNLEEECRKKFLRSAGHGVGLTRDGRVFRERIQLVLKQFDSLERMYKVQEPVRREVTLRIGGSHSVSAAILPDSLVKFKRRRPGIRVVVETAISSALEQRLLDSQLEIGLITNPSRNPLIVYESYEDLKVTPFVDPKSGLAEKTMTLKELAKTPLVLRTGSIILDELMQLGYRPNVVAECELSQAVIGAVQRRMGIGILHSDSVEEDIAAGNLKRIHVPELEALRFPSFIIYAAGKTLGPPAQAFLEVLHERKPLRNSRRDRKVKAHAQ